MPYLYKHEQSSTIGMYKTVSEFLTLRDIIIAIIQLYRSSKKRYQATGTIKGRRWSGQPRIMTRRQDATLTAF